MYLFSHAISLLLVYVRAFPFAENRLTDPTGAHNRLQGENVVKAFLP